jgi:hypothetical protein
MSSVEFIESGASEDKVESFIANVSTDDVPPEKAVELVCQLHDISKTESIPLDQVPRYIEGKLQEKLRVDEGIKEAEATLQSKNLNIQAINEHLALNDRESFVEEVRSYVVDKKDRKKEQKFNPKVKKILKPILKKPINDEE